MKQRRLSFIPPLFLIPARPTQAAYALGLVTSFLWSMTTTAAEPPLKVFVLAGQSNMQGHANLRTINAMRLDDATASLRTKMLDHEGNPRVCDQVWISSIGSSPDERTGKLTAGFGADPNGSKIGPEFTFGIVMQELLDEPILIIKTAWGGKSLHTDFRPPSAGPYQFNPSQLEAIAKQEKDLAKIKADKAEATGLYYRLMRDHIKFVLADIGRIYPDYDATRGYELAGFVWFQGWNDMVDRGVYPNRDQPGGYDQYTNLLAHFIRDIRQDLDTPKLPFVIGVMGAGGPTDRYSVGQMRYKPIHDNFRNAMAAPALLPQFNDSVVAVRTEKFWDRRLMELRTRDAQLKQKVSQAKEEKQLDRQAEQQLLNQLRNAEFDNQELELLNDSVSNQEYHYLGSARILGPIGKGFADALIELVRRQSPDTN